MRTAATQTCPKCRSTNLTKLDEHTCESAIFGSFIKAYTSAYKCECGMAFVRSERVESPYDPESVLA